MKYAIRTYLITLMTLTLLACSEDQSSDDHVVLAEQLLQNEEVTAAVIELKNALQKNGGSAKARWLLGKAYLDQGDPESAAKELERASDLGWDRNMVQPALAEALLAVGKYAQIRELSLLNLKVDAEARVLAIQAQSELEQGEIDAAEKLLREADKRAPGSTEVLMARAKIDFDQQEYEESLASLDEVLAAEPEFVPAIQMRGDVLMAQEKVEEAIQAYGAAIKLDEDDLDLRFKRALLRMQQQDFDASRRDVAYILRNSRKHGGANYLNGLLQFNKGEYEKAAASLAISEPLSTVFPVLHFYLASAHFMQNNLDQAMSFAGQFVDRVPDSVGGRKLLAAIHLRQADYQGVERVLSPLIQSDIEDAGILNIMANALLRDGRGPEGLALLERVSALEAESAEAQLRHGAGLLLEGQDDRAVEQFEKALAMDPTLPQAEVMLVLGLLQQKNYPAAIEAAKTYRDGASDKPMAHNLLGYVYMQAKQPNAAKEVFDASLQLEADNPSAHLYLSQMALDRGDLETARSHSATILEERTDFLPALMQMGRIAEAAEDQQALLGYLTRATDAHPTALQARIVLGRYYLASQEPDKVAPLFITLDKAQKESPQALRVLAMAHLATRSFDEALHSLDQLDAITTSTAIEHHWMAEAAAGKGDTARVKLELQSALELDENFVLSRIAVARAARAEGDQKAFDLHLKKLTEIAPENADVLQLRAIVAHKSGDTAKAIRLAKRAFEIAPGTAQLLDVVAYSNAAGETTNAIRVLSSWLDDHPNDVAALLALAEIQQATRQLDEAMAQYKRILEVQDDNTIALNNLAWYLREQNPKQALEYAKRSAKISPDSPEVLDTLAVVMYLNNDMEGAKRTIALALRKGSANPSISYHGAMIHAETGNKNTARDTLQRLLSKGESFPEEAAARKLLAELLQ